MIDDGVDSYKWTYVPSDLESDWRKAYVSSRSSRTCTEGAFWSVERRRYMGCGISTEWSPVTEENIQCGFPSMEGWEVVCCHELAPGMLHVLFDTVTYTELYAAAFASFWDPLQRCSPTDQSVAAVQPKTEPVGGGKQIEPSRPLDLNFESADGNSKELSKRQLKRAKDKAKKATQRASW
jgi:hypothetical protein